MYFNLITLAPGRSVKRPMNGLGGPMQSISGYGVSSRLQREVLAPFCSDEPIRIRDPGSMCCPSNPPSHPDRPGKYRPEGTAPCWLQETGCALSCVPIQW